MRAILALTAAGTMACAAGVASAQTWVRLAQTGPETIYYDPAAATAADGTVTATLRAVFDPPQPSGSVQVASMVERMAIDCRAGRYSDLGNVAYDASGRELFRTGPSSPKSIASGSGAVAIAAKVCR